MKREKIGLILVSFMGIALLCFGAYEFYLARHYQLQTENQYHRAFGDLVDQVGNLSVELKKGKAVTDSTQMSSLSADLWRKASFAKANLGQLPISEVELENTSKFLSQVGEYTYALSKKMQNGEELTADEKKKMRELSDYAQTLYSALCDMQTDFYVGDLNFEKVKKVFAEEAPDFASSLETVEKEFADYPSLVYDGPFSEHINRLRPRETEGKKEISQGEAEEIARDFFRSEMITSVLPLEEGKGVIPVFCFEIKTQDKDREIRIAISKFGGYVVWLLDNGMVMKSVLSVEDGADRAKRFLNEHGFPSMRECYYERIGNTLLVNFAYTADNVVMYPDLIKVKVSLEDGRVIGFESNGYLMNHLPSREFPQQLMDPDEARDIARTVMRVSDQNLCVIPTESKREVLCYEFKGRIDEDEYLIYLNAETGREEQILLLLIAENGTLTI